MPPVAANDNLPSAATIRFSVEPRLVPPQKAARRLHLSLSEFKERLPCLRVEGFPPPCSITGHFDLKAIDIWLDRRAGLDGDVRGSPLDNERILQDGFAALG